MVHRLAHQLGHEAEGDASPRTLFAAMAAEIKAFAGMTYGRLQSEPGMPVQEEVSRVG